MTVEKLFPENLFSEMIRSDKVYYETRNFINNVLPFSLHTDIMVSTTHHYVHKHREIEILMPVSGAGQVIADLKTIPISGEEIAVINPNKVHYIVSEEPLRYYVLIIDTDFLIENGMDPSVLCFRDHIRDHELSEMIRELDREWNREDAYRNLCLRSLLIGIMIRLCRYHVVTDTTTEKEGRTLQKIKHSINYIKNNYRRNLTLDEIADEAGLSKYPYCREFKKATDLTPIEFINRTRCEYAKNLLESRRYSVAEVSEMCGFVTAAHFSKVFRGFFGMNPSEYHRARRKDNAKETKR